MSSPRRRCSGSPPPAADARPAVVVGAAKEISGYWRNLAETAVLEERRRITRDLHDGVAQELAYIGRRAGRLGPGHRRAPDRRRGRARPRRLPRRRKTMSGLADAHRTSREWQVLDLLRQEHSTAEIARRLSLAPATVRTHVAAILRKLGVPDRQSVVARFRL